MTAPVGVPGGERLEQQVVRGLWRLGLLRPVDPGIPYSPASGKHSPRGYCRWNAALWNSAPLESFGRTSRYRRNPGVITARSATSSPAAGEVESVLGSTGVSVRTARPIANACENR